MKVLVWIFFILLLLTPLLSLQAQFSLGDTVTVSVRETVLRQQPRNLSRTVARLTYEQSLVVQETRPGWIKVTISSSGQSGWVSDSAVIANKGEVASLLGRSSSSTTGAGDDEVALAGKGFNSEVEAEYKSRENLDYSWVDEMETYLVSLDDILDFIDEGDLSAGGAQ